MPPSGEQVFLKEFNDPTPLSEWYRPYIAYQDELKRRVESTDFRGFCYRFIEFFEFAAKAGKSYYHQVFEFVPNGLSLQQALEDAREHPDALPWERRVIMAKVMMAGIKAMHAARLIHSDLKPDNLILIPVDPHAPGAGFKLRIIDLDFSLLADRKPPPWHGHDGLEYFGTEDYMSPEHLAATGPEYASDVFTCGLMLYELLGREGHPYRRFSGDDYFAAAREHRAAVPTLLGTMPAPAQDAEVRKIIHRCLAARAADRPTAAEVHQTLLGFPVPPAREPHHHDAPHAPAPHAPPPVPKPLPPPPRPQRLVLRGAGGTTLDFGIRTPVGRELCKALGEEYRYFSDPVQFTVERGCRLGGHPGPGHVQPHCPERPAHHDADAAGSRRRPRRGAGGRFRQAADDRCLRGCVGAACRELPMPWTCPQDGCQFENPDGEASCKVCGYRRVAPRLALVGPSGRSVDMGVTTVVGRDLLADVVEGEQRFASAAQFRIVKDASGWLVQHDPSARNPTCYQGNPLGATPVPLEDGGILTVGRESCKLTVRFLF